MRTLKIRRQESLRKILKNVDKNLLSSKEERKIKRQRKRSSYLDNYELSLIVKRAWRNFNNTTSLNRDERDNRDERNCANINLGDRERD